MLESGFWRNACDGLSPMPITSVVGTISNVSGGQFSRDRISSIRTLSPNRTILLSLPMRPDALMAPDTTACGA